MRWGEGRQRIVNCEIWLVEKLLVTRLIKVLHYKIKRTGLETVLPGIRIYQHRVWIFGFEKRKVLVFLGFYKFGKINEKTCEFF